MYRYLQQLSSLLIKRHLKVLQNIHFMAMSSSGDEVVGDCMKLKLGDQDVGVAISATLETLNFDNYALTQLPIDPISDNRQRQVRGACFSRVSPTPVRNPATVVYSASAMSLLDLPERELQRSEFAEYFSGNRLLPGSEPAAHCYCGHQFGFFAGQLGDGAAMYLGEIVNKSGERWEVQLKGAGKTPFSRTADGRKVLRSSIREFLCSEAMYHLGIPTTRAGCCITSDSTVVRDIFYDGNPINEKCTIVSRIAPSFVRFGSFEICKGPDRQSGRDGPSAGQPHILKQLADYVIKTFYPNIWQSHYPHNGESAIYVEFFKEVVRRTASLVAHWQCVGFCHGVLNTDNMSILGITIDYGPFGFLDRYDVDHICNASDDGGRYAYGRQPEICKWNCMKLAEVLRILAPMEQLVAQLELYDNEFKQTYIRLMRNKLGLLNVASDSDSELVESLLDTMQKTGADFTNTFRCLSRIGLPRSVDGSVSNREEARNYIVEQCATIEELKAAYAPQMDPGQMAMLLSLLQSNPEMLNQVGKIFGQVAVELDKQSKLEKLQQQTSDMKTQENAAVWDTWLDKYEERLREETNAAKDVDCADKARRNVMNNSNPSVVLRNHIAQTAIDAAETGDFTVVQKLLKILERPYDDQSPNDATVSMQDAVSQSKDAEAADADARPSACSRASLTSLYLGCKPPASAAQLRVT